MRVAAAVILAACSPDPRIVVDASDLGDGFCPPVELVARPSTPSIHVLLDRSGSMLEDFGSGQTRFAAMREALVGPGGAITQRESAAYFGASLYAGARTCPDLKSVLPRTMNNRASIATLLDTATPEGSTPTAEAVERVRTYYAAQPPPDGSTAMILLVTDGGPTSCGGTIDPRVAAVDAVQLAKQRGIRTFVLGFEDPANASHLQALANAGVGVIPGTMDAPVFTATDPDTLAAAIDEIIDGVLDCELTLDRPVDPAAAASGSIALDGDVLEYGRDWVLVDGQTVRLLGAACDRLRTATDPRVTIAFPCGAIVL